MNEMTTSYVEEVITKRSVFITLGMDTGHTTLSMTTSVLWSCPLTVTFIRIFSRNSCGCSDSHLLDADFNKADNRV